jgi:hypothetical protein
MTSRMGKSAGDEASDCIACHGSVGHPNVRR